MLRWVVTLAMATVFLAPVPLHAADLSFSTVPGEEVTVNGIFDVGETITVHLSATYGASEAAVNYQVDLSLTGDLTSFGVVPGTPPPPAFGSPGSATCALPTADLARCFGNVDLIADPNARVQGPVTVSLGSFVVTANAGPGESLTITPAVFFTEELVADANSMLVGSPLPFDPQGLDPNGNVLDIESGGPLDSDGDGVFDDGDLSGNPNDNPCTTGSANAPCDDNCRYTANPDQSDVGGVVLATPDGNGDVCQCGDVNNSGTVNVGDVAKYNGWLSNPNEPNFDTTKCNVSGSTDCNLTDVARIKMGLAAGGTSNDVKQQCEAAQPGP